MVMIVDDNSGMREAIKASLANSLSEFCECSDGSQALSMYAQYLPTWVLMDIRMATMDGIAATRAIKESFPAARIVIVTNYDDKALREEAMQAGAMGFVLKDDLSLLLNVIGNP